MNYKLYILITCSLLFIYVGKSYGQSSINGEMYIDNNSVVVLDGETELNGVLENNGTLSINGNLLNRGWLINLDNALFAFREAGLILEGGNYKLNDLVVGSQGIVQVKNAIILEIMSTLNLDSGMISIVPEGAAYISENTVITGGSDSSYIEGKVIHLGGGVKYYPLGMDGTFTPVYIDKSGSGELGTKIEKPLDQIFKEEDIYSLSNQRLWSLHGDADELASIQEVEIPINDESFLRNFFDVLVAGSNEKGGIYSAQNTIELFETNRLKKEGSIVITKATGINYLIVGEKVNRRITIKNLITPNSDGKNDYLHIENIEKYENNEVIILNRWGQEIFRQENYDNRWDTSIGGNPLPTGTYTCIVYLNGDAEKQKYVRFINVIAP